MSTPEIDLEELRRALREASPDGEEPAADADRIWAAAAGELTPEETAAVVDRLAASPALMEAWRLAVAMQRQMEQALPAPLPLRRSRPARAWGWAAGLAAAAALAVGIGLPLLLEQRGETGERFRGGGAAPGESRLEPGAALPRDAFEIEWRPGPEGAVYGVVVSDETLAPLAHASDLTESRYRVPAAALAGVADGATVLWQVTVRSPDGTLERSATHRQRVAPR